MRLGRNNHIKPSSDNKQKVYQKTGILQQTEFCCMYISNSPSQNKHNADNKPH